jgi:hypothetical protein
VTNNTTLPRQSYPPVPSPVNAARRQCAAVVLACSFLAASTLAQDVIVPADACPSHLTALFAPTDPDAPDAYRVCRSPRPLEQLKPAEWPMEQLSATDAFAGAPPGVRRTVALLYGGRAVRVSRGWRRRPSGIEAITLLAPPPDDGLRRLTSGTLVLFQVRTEHGGRPPVTP